MYFALVITPLPSIIDEKIKEAKRIRAHGNLVGGFLVGRRVHWEVPASQFHIALDKAFLLLLKGHFNNFHKRFSAIVVHESHTVEAWTGKH